MLKLNYTDYGLFLEQVTASLDAVATQRVMLAVYAGEPLHLEPGRAAFLLQADIPGVAQLKRVLQSDATEAISLTLVDGEFVEVSLKGTWIANSANAEAGTFITALAPESERLIYQLWQATQRQTAYSI
ncbi:MAG: alr0857 family protein [Cyanobacteria bacterium P01_G01_bin.38]